MALRSLAAWALAVSFTACRADAPRADQLRSEAIARAERPNIVLIFADDVGIEAFSSYGEAEYETPEISALARAGMLFRHCHAQPLCTPSRVKLLSGISNARNYEAFSILPRGSKTFAHRLRDAGYKTCVVGKWQLLGAEHYPPTIRGTGSTPRDAGFDEWCLWQVRELGKRYWKPRVDTKGEVTTGDAKSYGPDVYTQYLLDFIDREKDGPFLAYYPMALVHSPFLPTPSSEGAGPEARANTRFFGDMVAHMDRLVGRIRRHLEKRGLAERTLLVFTSDNGTHRKITSRFNGRNVRGGKGTTTWRSTHVPMIAYWPKTVRPGSVCEDLVDLSDFTPSLAELAGIACDGVDGQSFAPQLRGLRGRPREAITCYYHPRPKTRKRSRAVRFAFDKTHKLYADGRLFDLRVDPEEKQALSPRQARASRTKLRAALEGIRDGASER